ncbi:hypothetical protein LA76x_3746 [Lysobacter antibioticus]|uniref:Uncharacterized protein n=1 Tax=Lysobacter antibioticus TaxID=84531 RepID=A0A0S2FEB4_LYSAN|nr:hypothetical protein LA76x_3746 [Lysobacter antibioticus]
MGLSVTLRLWRYGLRPERGGSGPGGLLRRSIADWDGGRVNGPGDCDRRSRTG